MPRAQTPQQRTATVDPNIRAHVCQRASWSDDWTYAPYVEALRATRATAPDLHEANFRFRFGRIKRAGSSAYAVEGPEDLLDRYVQVRLIPAASPSSSRPSTSTPEQAVWTGIVTEEGMTPHGSDAGVAQGDQQFRAWGLGHLLDQYAIRDARAMIDGTQQQLATAPPINGRSGWGPGVGGNMSASTGSDGVRIYSASSGYTPWTARKYIEYLLQYHQPADLTFQLDAPDELLDYALPLYEVEGRTPWQVLEHILPRQRGIVWQVRVDGQDVRLVVDSVFGQAVSAGGSQIPANRRTTQVDFTDDPRIQQPEIRENNAARYDQVIVRGEPIVSCFSVTMSAGTLERMWSDTDESEYASATRAGRQEDIHRLTYRGYRVPEGWSWESGGHTAAPAATESGGVDTDTTRRQFSSAKSLLRWIPIPEAGETAITGATRKPFVWGEKDGSKVRLDAGEPDGDLPSIGLQMRDQRLELEIEASPNHLLAKNHLDANSLTGDQEVRQAPLVDYDTIGLTAAVRLDQRLQYHAQIRETSAANPRTVTIDVPGAEYWYVTPATVAEISDGAEETWEDYVFDHGDLSWIENSAVRDDSDRLAQVAALAKIWYGQARRPVSFTLERLSGRDWLGYYVDAAFADAWEIGDVGTCVTQCRWDFEEQTTHWETAYHQLDLRRIVEFPGMSGPRSLARTVQQHDRRLRDLRERTGDLPTRRVQEAGQGGGYPLLYEVTAVDTTAGTVTVQRRISESDADGTNTPSINGVYYIEGTQPQVGMVGNLKMLDNGELCFLHHIRPDSESSNTSLGDSGEGTESADASTWLITDDRTKGLELTLMTRVAYYHGGDETLYGYVRTFTFDLFGHLVEVSAESRVGIDVAELCS